MDIVLLIGSLAVILVAAELFTNSIEWFGHRLNLAEGAVGSVLAAVATAMPETLIPVIAILGPLIFGGDPEASHAIGVGAILGAPFMLSTLAMFVTGVAVILYSRSGRRGTGMRVNVRVLGRDVGFFVVAYSIAIGTAFLPAELSWLKWVAAALLIVIYAVYVRLHFTDAPEPGDPEALNRLHATRLPGMAGPHTLDIDILPGEQDSWEVESDAPPRMRIIVSQVVVALALIIIGAQVFVGAVEHLSITHRPRPDDPCPHHRADRDGASREVQQRAVGAQYEGHAGDGQHHRRHGLPELPSDRARPAVHDLDLHRGERDQLRVGRRGHPGHAPHLREHAAHRTPLGVDAPDRWAALPRLRVPGPVHAARGGCCRPLIPQHDGAGRRPGAVRWVYFLRLSSRSWPTGDGRSTANW